MLDACYISSVCFGYFPVLTMSIKIKLKPKAKAIKRGRKRQAINISWGFQVYCCQLKYVYLVFSIFSFWELKWKIASCVSLTLSFLSRLISQSKFAIKFTKFEFAKCFIYEILRGVCCDSEKAEELFTFAHWRDSLANDGEESKFPFFFHNLNTLSFVSLSLSLWNATLHFISISHLITSDTFVERQKMYGTSVETETGKWKNRKKEIRENERRQ